MSNIFHFHLVADETCSCSLASNSAAPPPGNSVAAGSSESCAAEQNDPEDWPDGVPAVCLLLYDTLKAGPASAFGRGVLAELLRGGLVGPRHEHTDRPADQPAPHPDIHSRPLNLWPS